MDEPPFVTTYDANGDPVQTEIDSVSGTTNWYRTLSRTATAFPRLPRIGYPTRSPAQAGKMAPISHSPQRSKRSIIVPTRPMIRRVN